MDTLPLKHSESLNILRAQTVLKLKCWHRRIKMAVWGLITVENVANVISPVWGSGWAQPSPDFKLKTAVFFPLVSSVLSGLEHQSPKAKGQWRGAAFPEPFAWHPVPARHQREPVKPARGHGFLRPQPVRCNNVVCIWTCPITLPEHGWALAAYVYITVFVELRPWLLVTKVDHSQFTAAVWTISMYIQINLCRFRLH